MERYRGLPHFGRGATHDLVMTPPPVDPAMDFPKYINTPLEELMQSDMVAPGAKWSLNKEGDTKRLILKVDGMGIEAKRMVSIGLNDEDPKVFADQLARVFTYLVRHKGFEMSGVRGYHHSVSVLCVHLSPFAVQPTLTNAYNFINENAGGQFPG